MGSIHELYRRYCPEPVLVVMDVQPKVGAFEAEEVGVEHLLRDIKNASASTLAVRVADKIAALKGLSMRLTEISKYLTQVHADKMPMNEEIIYQLQDIFNLLPDQDSEELVKSFAMETNDMMLALYLGSILRSTVALHNLINNKIKNKKLKEKKQEEKEKEKEKKDEEKKKDDAKADDDADDKDKTKKDKDKN